MVMDKGQVAEYGPPAELLRRDGPFAALVDSTGEGSAAELRRQALSAEAVAAEE